MEQARRAIADNRASASAGQRFWELSRGILFCAECGRSMAAWAPKGPKKAGPFYYRCGARHKARGNVPARCPNNKCHRAEQLEHEATGLFEQYADRGTLLELYDRAIAAELAAVEERAAAIEQMRAVRDSLSGSLAASYIPMHAEWEEDPDAILPSEYLTAAASQEEIRRAYRRYGVRFEVDREGVLTLRLTLAAGVHLESSSA